MTEEILNARRNVRRIERIRRSTGLMIYKELIATAFSDLGQLISAAKERSLVFVFLLTILLRN